MNLFEIIWPTGRISAFLGHDAAAKYSLKVSAIVFHN